MTWIFVFQKAWDFRFPLFFCIYLNPKHSLQAFKWKHKIWYFGIYKNKSILSSKSNRCYNISKHDGFVEGIFTSPKVCLVKKNLLRARTTVTKLEVPAISNGNFYNTQSFGGINDSNLRCIQAVTCNCSSLNHCSFSWLNKACVNSSRWWV